MEKFPSQQQALKAALSIVLKQEPKKGQLVITDEQRQEVGKLMLMWYQQELWSIRPGTRAAANPLNYIVGKQPTCLIEAWTIQKPQQAAAPVTESKFDLIKRAMDAGILSKEEAQARIAALLDGKQ